MSKIKLGAYNTLTVLKIALREGNGEPFGLFLDGGPDGEILMPQKYVPEGTEIGDEIEVFVYLDQEERPIATTEEPLAQVGDFAYLECSWVNEYGAFLSWGVMKDLFCPFREQKKRMVMGNSYIVHIHLDEDSYRLVASAKVEHYLDERRPRDYKHGQEVNLLVWQKTDLGFKVIVDNQYPGLIYEHNGICDLGDKSEAEDIKRRFQVSKKVYKRAIGDLYKRRLITVEPLAIRLVGEQ